MDWGRAGLTPLLPRAEPRRVCYRSRPQAGTRCKTHMHLNQAMCGSGRMGARAGCPDYAQKTLLFVGSRCNHCRLGA